MSITTAKNAQAELELAAINLAVLLAPYGTTMPDDLEDNTSGDLSIPEEFVSLGNFTKADGQTLGKAETNTEIESHGESDPTRIITNKRTITVAGRFQETNRGTLEAYWGEDFSTVAPSAHGGIVLPVSPLPKNIHYRLLLVAEDDYNGDPIYAYWMAPRAKVTTTGDIQMTDNGLITFPLTFTFTRDSVLDYSVRPGYCGAGWVALQGDADTGFYAAATSVTVHPDTLTLAVAEQAQLTVIDNNGNDRTASATFAASAPAIASVGTNSGRVLGVSTGTSTITATVGALTDTCVVTVP